MKFQKTFFINLICILISLSFFLLFILLLKYNRQLYISLGKEGIWFERATSVFYLAAGTCCMLSCSKLIQYFKIKSITSHKLPGMLWILFWAFFFFFITGEEESWGQWIMGFKSTEFFQEINYQNETNIHNLNFIPFDNHSILNLICLFFGIIFPVVLSIKRIQLFLFCKYILIPRIFVIYFFIAGLLYEKFANLIEKSWVHSEFSEFFYSLGFFAFAISTIQNVKQLNNCFVPINNNAVKS